MTTIYLIRHGQASVGTDNYDVLSKTGEAQANVLGQHLANTHIEFDAVYSGALKRQIDTATIATGACSIRCRNSRCADRRFERCNDTISVLQTNDGVG